MSREKIFLYETLPFGEYKSDKCISGNNRQRLSRQR